MTIEGLIEEGEEREYLISLDQVLASSRITKDERALWPGRRPTIARQACVDEIAKHDDKLQTVLALPCPDCPDNAICLGAKRVEVGPLMYDQEFLTTPRSSASSLFPFERMEPLLDPELACLMSYEPEDERRYVVCNAWDLAWSERTGGDYLAKVTARLDRKTGKRRILDIQRWRGLSFRDQVGLIRLQHGLFSASLTVLEEAGAQSVWVQEVRQVQATKKDGETVEVQNQAKDLIEELKDMRVLGHTAGTKRSFSEGVPSLLLDIEAKRWEFPWMEDSYHHAEMLNFLSECEAFGWNEDKLEGVGEHDDTVMAWWHCSWGLDQLSRRRATISAPTGTTINRRR